VNKMVKLIFKYVDFKPKLIKYLTRMPTGPINRVADISMADKILGWKPKYRFEEGLKKTVNWYIKSKNKAKIKTNLEKLLMGK